MKKALLLLMAAMLLLTAACSGGLGTMTQTTTTKATGKNQAWKDLIKEEEVEDEAPVFDVESIAPVTAQLIGEDYPTDNTFYPEFDFDYDNMKNSPVVYVAEMGRYCMLIGNFLMYADEDTMFPQPMCTKADCQHNLAVSLADKRACEAYVCTNDQSVAFHYNSVDGRLYLAHETADEALMLESFLPDGTDRREEFTHEKQENFSGAFMGSNRIFHRGRFYYTCTEWKGNNSYIDRLWSYALSTPDAEPELLYTAQNPSDNPLGLRLSVYGRYLYITEALGIAERVGSSLLYDNAGLILDLASGEWMSQTRMHDVPEEFAFSSSFVRNGKLVAVYEDRAYYYVQQEINQSNQGNNDKLEDVQPQYLYVESEPDGLDPVILENGEAQSFNVSDDNYVCDFLPEAESCNQVALNVCDHAGNVVREVTYGEFFPQAYEATYKRFETVDIRYAAYLPGADKLLLLAQYHTSGYWGPGDCTFYCIDLADVEDPNVPLEAFFSYSTREYDIDGE